MRKSVFLRPVRVVQRDHSVRQLLTFFLGLLQVNRIHRIGQSAKTVRVRKFVVNDSVEERIVELQNRKQSVADEIYSNDNEHENEGGMGNGARLGLEEFRLIFQR